MLLALKMYAVFGTELTLVVLTMIGGIALLSAVLANVPVAAASILVVKGYLVAAEAVPGAALDADFTHWPAATIPVFVAMMLGATLGGDATLIGASANISVRGHLCAPWQGAHIRDIPARFDRPITVVQLAAGRFMLSSCRGG